MAPLVKREYTDAEKAVAAAYVAVRAEVKITRLDENGRAHPAEPLSVQDAAGLLAVGASRIHKPYMRRDR